ncbi:F-box/FBD/LRR-repeat protein At1g13570-like [Bidens hawaiensis]|uniref:F-box/FBD/LRR-repeat protein At1g13570-like n=1 Tax=Bidens hawaiensis TaxID=980011 RepID=UPI00404ABFB6
MSLIHGTHKIPNMHGTHKAPKLASEDFISNMPNNVLTNILDRLPLQDAVRTSVLARNWRFNWTMLSQLVFDVNFFKYLSKTEGHENNYGIIITRVLMHIKGVITKFVLYIDERWKLDDEDINDWILFLSNKGVKDITLWNKKTRTFKLSAHLFSCLELKHLKLVHCCFDPSSGFHGFPNLLRLELLRVRFKTGKIGKFFTGCPALMFLDLYLRSHVGSVKLGEIAKLKNLKSLSLNLFNLERTAMTSSSGIFELVGSLPKLQGLHLDFSYCKSFTVDVAGKRSRTTFSRLKDLKLTGIDLGNGIMLSCVFELTRCFPNLQALKITARNQDDDPAPASCSDCNKMGPLQLQTVVFNKLVGSNNEVCLIKYLLSCSPFLKKLVTHPFPSLASDEKFALATKLLKLHPASPDVDIDLC